MLSVKRLKMALYRTNSLKFYLPGGDEVPAHFHITEAGLVTRHFIDCGGKVRKTSALSMQIWTAEDYDHRLAPSTLLKIINKAEPLYKDEGLPVEIEYQSGTIGRYNLGFDGADFHLIKTETDCLAKNNCGIERNPQKTSIEFANATDCIPATGCC